MMYRSFLLVCCHIALITFSNVLVQYPFTIFGLHTTWGAFSYPGIFIATDLTVRLYGKKQARKIIFYAMFPGLIISYLCAVQLAEGSAWLNVLAARVAIACFTAYVVGQLLDIKVFSKLRQNPNWWLAPMGASFVGNVADTVIFFSIAFYHCADPVLSANWPEIALVDFCFKGAIIFLFGLPLYGIVLRSLILRAQRIAVV